MIALLGRPARVLLAQGAARALPRASLARAASTAPPARQSQPAAAQPREVTSLLDTIAARRPRSALSAFHAALEAGAPVQGETSLQLVRLLASAGRARHAGRALRALLRAQPAFAGSASAPLALMVAVEACARDGQPRSVLRLFRAARAAGVGGLDLPTYNAVLGAVRAAPAAKPGRSAAAADSDEADDRAVAVAGEVVAAMYADGLSPCETTFATLVGIHVAADRLAAAVQLLRGMREQGITPGLDTYVELVAALEQKYDALTAAEGTAPLLVEECERLIAVVEDAIAEDAKEWIDVSLDSDSGSDSDSDSDSDDSG